jgi:hypothetical protein
MTRSQIFNTIIGTILTALGVLILLVAVEPTHPFVWAPAFLILLGFISLSGAVDPNEEKFKLNDRGAIVAAVFILGGILILLRQIGVIDAPLLQYGLGGFLIAVGIYGLYLGLSPWINARMSDSPRHTHIKH